MAIDEQFLREVPIFREEGIEKLNNSRVIVFGIGGVGGHATEALCRAGVGHIDIVDGDDVSISNLNRQAVALHSTLGRAKVDVMKERMLDIFPSCTVNTYKMFYLPENADVIDFTKYDYVIDCVDTVVAKLEIITRAKAAGVKVISAMGAGNKLDPTKFEVSDISKTSVCPLARVMRRELKVRGISDVKVVYSKEEPSRGLGIDKESRKSIPSSLPFVPSCMGLIIAGEVIKELAFR